MAPLRKCIFCGLEAQTENDLPLFVKSKNNKYGYRNTCKKCDYKVYGAIKKKYRKVKTTHLWERPWIQNKLCQVCGVKLTEENWSNYSKTHHEYKCHTCSKKLRMAYYQTHKPERRAYERKRRQDPTYRNKENERTREYSRKYILGQWNSEGKLTKVKCNKRPWTPICEVCGHDVGLRAYHHWNDNNYDNGMWLCRYCHIFAERVDAGLVNKYLELKATIDACNQTTSPNLEKRTEGTSNMPT